MKSWHHSTEVTGAALVLREIPVPVPKAGELLVRVKAASLNRGEFLARPSKSAGKPAGIECAGEVVNIGSPGASGFVSGQRVMGRATFAFSEYALMQAGDVAAVPDCFDWDEAACGSITYQVAYEMLRVEGNLQPGEWLLITGVTSGVGLAALQLGKLWGAQVIGTSRSVARLDVPRCFGLDYGLVCPADDLSARVMELTAGHGADLVVNNVGGSLFADCLKAMAYKGRLATVGNLDGVGRAEIDLLTQHSKRLRLFGVSNKMRSTGERAESVAGFIHDVLPSMNIGALRPVIAKSVPFEHGGEAVALMLADAQVGKIVIRF
jgi:NADPH2:quinone reductase